MKKLRHIWSQVPADYFASGVETNFLQQIWHLRKLTAVLETIGKKRMKRMLDVGSADGSFLNRLLQRISCSSAFAVDPYLPPLVYGKGRFRQAHYIQGDAHRLPFRSHSLELVTILETLEHVVDPYAVLMELRRITKKNGAIIVEMDSGSFLFRIVWFLWKQFGKGKVWQDAHLTLFSSSTLEKLFIEAGFKTQKKNLFNLGMGICYRLSP